jgi:Tol biopolymer transport system component
VLTECSDDARTQRFAFLDATNLPSRDRGHMDQAEFRFVDDDHFHVALDLVPGREGVVDGDDRVPARRRRRESALGLGRYGRLGKREIAFADEPFTAGAPLAGRFDASLSCHVGRWSWVLASFGEGLVLTAAASLSRDRSERRRRRRASASTRTGSRASAGGELRPGTSLSADGRRVVFASDSPNLVPGDTNANWDVFVRDRLTGTVDRCSVSTSGVEGDASPASTASRSRPTVATSRSAAARHNLVAGDTNGQSDVFLRDLTLGTTERVSLDSRATRERLLVAPRALSADGRFVAFTSIASNLVPGDTNGQFDTFVRDRATGTTTARERLLDRAEVHDGTYRPSISADGRYVAFESLSSEFVPGDTNLAWDVFVRDRWSGATERISLSSAGVQGNDASWEGAIYDDGRYVVFSSYASNLVPGDGNGDLGRVHPRPASSGPTQRVSVASDGTEGDHASSTGSMSADPGTSRSRARPRTSRRRDLGPAARVRARPRRGATILVSAGFGGDDAERLEHQRFDLEQRSYVSFQSDASNLVAGDGNGSPDVFVRDARPPGRRCCASRVFAPVIACPLRESAFGFGARMRQLGLEREARASPRRGSRTSPPTA